MTDAHEIASREQTMTSWVLTCSCGKPFTHRDAPAAERLWEYHAGLENSRLALRGGKQ